MAEYKLYNLKDPKTGQEEPQISSKEEFDALKQKVKPDQIKNPRTGTQGDAESIVKEENTQQADAVNIAKELGKVLRDALQEHGDELQGAFLKNLNTKGVTVKIVYKPDEQGQQTEDEFNFNWQNGNVSLELGNQSIDLGQIQNRSGRSYIQKDLLKDKLLGFLNNAGDSQAAPSDAGQIPDGQPVQEEWPDDHLGQQDSLDGDGDYQEYAAQSLHEDAWENENDQNAFIEAVKMYKCAKDKEAIKGLFRACRPYRAGNTIQEKLKGAVDWYNWFTENPPKNTQKQVFLEDDIEEGSLDTPGVITAVHKISEGLNILKEYINRSEDAHLGSYYRDIRESFDRMIVFVQSKFKGDQSKKLDEFFDLDDPIAQDRGEDFDDYDYQDGIKPNYDFDKQKDDLVVGEMDEFGPEVGDQIDYNGGHYKLYGYCGYEVVIQNVDDERDFKVVKPADIGIGQKQQVKETEYIDPEQLPDDNQEEI